jgi:hypothetical protein
LSHPHSPGQVQHSTPTSSVSVRLPFSVWLGGGFCLPRGSAGIFSWGVGRGVALGTCSLIQAALEPAGGENWLCFFFFSVAWHREAFHGLGVQDGMEFDSD